MATTRRKIPIRLEERYRLDGITMLVYITLVYGWSIFLHPMGRDFAAFASHGAEFPWPSRMLWLAATNIFGGFTPGYHLLNMALMFGCMFAFYVYANRVFRGPTWVGMLAANLFMANPLHLESMLNLSGSVDLLPAFAALAALAAYATHVENPTARTFTILTALTAIATFLWPQHAMLPAVMLLHEGLLTGSHRRSRWRLSLGGLALVASLVVHSGSILGPHWNIATAWGPLAFVAYCIGFLPETVQTITTQPLFGWAIAAGFIIGLALIHRKSRHAAVPFAIIAMLLLRLVPDSRPIDPVHLIGGGQLVLAQAIFMLAFAAVYLRIMDHPKWRGPLIYGSISISVMFFILTGVSAYRWHVAADELQVFRTRAATLEPGTRFAPDFRYYRGAPLCLSDSVQHDTPFSKALDIEFALPLHYLGEGYQKAESSITFQGGTRTAMVPFTGLGSDQPRTPNDPSPTFDIGTPTYTDSIPNLVISE